MAAAIPMAASGIGALFSGIGASKKKTAESTSQFSQSGTQDANLDKNQKKVNKALFAKILEAIQMGPNVSQSDRNTMRGQMNDTYDATNTNIAANMAARGFSGGKVGGAFRSNALDRAKGFQTGEATLRDQASNRFQQMIQNAFAFLTPRSFSSTSQGTSSGTNTMPGTPWQSSVGSGLGDLSSVLYARNMGAFGGGGFGNAGRFGGGYEGANQGSGEGCAVAIELYGPVDWRTFAVRSYIGKQAGRSLTVALLASIYLITGRHLARWIRWHQPSRRLALTLFNGLLRKALNAK